MTADPHPRFGPLVDSSVTVATWNVAWRFLDFEARQPAILATLQRLDADIICLQEAWEWQGRSQPQQLADALGMHAVFAARYDFMGDRLGNAILSRWPIASHEHIALPCPADKEEFRLCLRADIDGPRGPLHVYTTHLHNRFEHAGIRDQEAAEVARFIQRTAEAKQPPILCADFNAPPDADCVRGLTGRSAIEGVELAMIDAWEAAGEGPGWTWDNRNPLAALELEPNRRIDYVLSGMPTDGGRGHVRKARVFGLSAVDGVQPSDHFGVVAAVRY